jgi:hypothetical protein
MKKASVSTLAGLLAALGIMSLRPTPADARIDCKFDHFTNIPITERPVFVCPRHAQQGPGLDEDVPPKRAMGR